MTSYIIMKRNNHFSLLQMIDKNIFCITWYNQFECWIKAIDKEDAIAKFDTYTIK